MSSNEQDAYHNTLVSLSIEDRVRALQRSICYDQNYEGWDSAALREAVLVSATPGTTEWEMTITPRMCNKSRNLHGGAACTILGESPMDFDTKEVGLAI